MLIRIHTSRALAIWTAVTLVPICLGQVPSQHGRIQPVSREPEYPGTQRIPMEHKNTIVLPSEPGEYGEPATEQSAGVVGQVALEQRRLPDGYVLARRPATVEQQGEWYVLSAHHVEGLPDAPPVRVLPNSQLALLETVLADHSRSAGFLVTGLITEFNGSNYVLLDSFREGSLSSPPPVQARVKAPATQPSTATTQPAREPTAEEVVRRLMQAQPRREVVLPQTTTATATQPAVSVAPTMQTGEPLRWAENTLLVDRPGRLIPGDTWWSFAFEDLSQSPQQKPIRVMPNQLLETAISLSNGGAAAGAVLVVSGEIAVYKGVDYLLLRKVLVRRDMGNLR